MSTGLIYSERFLGHDPGRGHPEAPARAQAIVRMLEETGLWDRLTHLPFGPADREQLARVHDPAYIQACFDACASGAVGMGDPDTRLCPVTAEVAQLASGGVIAAVDAVMAGEVDQAFCLVRPPGHHASFDRASGFCIFNHVAVAAAHLLAHHGLQRVAILDWDVHHGNGTQDLFEQSDSVLTISLHEHPSFLYPGTGFTHEKGRGPGTQYTLNLPLPPRSGDEDYRHAMVFKVMPALERFAPQFLLVSAGFDAARDETIAHMELTPEGFGWMTRHLKAEAERLCQGRMVSVLEGGYQLRSLAECVRVHIESLLPDTGVDHMMAMKAGF